MAILTEESCVLEIVSSLWVHEWIILGFLLLYIYGTSCWYDMDVYVPWRCFELLIFEIARPPMKLEKVSSSICFFKFCNCRHGVFLISIHLWLGNCCKLQIFMELIRFCYLLASPVGKERTSISLVCFPPINYDHLWVFHVKLQSVKLLKGCMKKLQFDLADYSETSPDLINLPVRQA